jgi:hypothetical protein
VVNLVIKRPANFTFKPGDYVYLNIPSIAQFEWHPFTISSAPEQTDTLSLHIRQDHGLTNRHTRTATGLWLKMDIPCLLHCKEISIYVFPEKELRGLSPNFHIHVSVSDLLYSFILRIKLYDLKTEVNQNKVKLKIK